VVIVEIFSAGEFGVKTPWWYYFGKDPKLTHAINRAKNKNKKLQNKGLITP